MKQFSRFEACPNTTFKVNFDYEGIPLTAILHMVACKKCRDYILSPPIQRTHNKSLLCIRELTMSKWRESLDPHINSRYLQLLIRLYYNQKDSETLVRHIEQCERCYKFAEKNKGKFQRKRKN